MAKTKTKEKRVGLIVGREWSFPPRFLDAVNERDEGVVADFPTFGGTHHDAPRGYDVLIDRISHEVPMYRSALKQAVVQGTTVVNNPFMWTADDKFLGAALITKLGVVSPKPWCCRTRRTSPASCQASRFVTSRTRSTGRRLSTTLGCRAFSRMRTA